MTFIRVSSNQFLNFVYAIGTDKAKEVSSIYDNKYEHYKDFYLIIRKKITNMFKANKSTEILNEFLRNFSNERKKGNYKAITKGLNKFLDGQEVEWFDTVEGNWIYRDLEISVKPELGLIIEGKKYLVKMYFKQESLDSQKAQYCLHLMHQALSISRNEEFQLAILDVRRGRLRFIDYNEVYNILLRREAEAFIDLWWNLQRPQAA